MQICCKYAIIDENHERGERLTVDLKALRKERGMTQEELANAVNIHRVTIAKYESGKVSPTLESAAKLAKALGVPIERLIKKAG